jgi:AraC-like DNA-binding protein
VNSNPARIAFAIPAEEDCLQMPKRREWLFQLNLSEKVSNGAKTSQMPHASNTFCRRYSLAFIFVPKLPSRLKENFDKPFSIKVITQETNMSPSGLHHHFKTLTNMPPLQYQKHLRLQEARRLMLVEAMDASGAAYHVGYASRSQFTREYSRLFGAPPFRDVEQIQQQPHAAAEL